MFTTDNIIPEIILILISIYQEVVFHLFYMTFSSEHQDNDVTEAIRDIQEAIDITQSKLQNLFIVQQEMNGDKKGIFMDSERDDLDALINTTQHKLSEHETVLAARIDYYNVEVKEMKTLIDQRYQLLSEIDEVLVNIPDCATILATGQMQLEEELNKRRHVLNTMK